MTRKPSAAQVRALLKYHPETGVLRWRVDRGCKIKAGDVAGSPNKINGRRRVGIDSRTYRAGHLIWLMQTGEWPPAGFEIDHRDRDPSNNRWANLRLATSAQNKWNTRKRNHNRSGFKGVCLFKPTGRFKASIRAGGKQRHLGYFADPWLAYLAYCKAARKLHGEFRRTA